MMYAHLHTPVAHISPLLEKDEDCFGIEEFIGLPRDDVIQSFAFTAIVPFTYVGPGLLEGWAQFNKAWSFGFTPNRMSGNILE